MYCILHVGNDRLASPTFLLLRKGIMDGVRSVKIPSWSSHWKIQGQVTRIGDGQFVSLANAGANEHCTNSIHGYMIMAPYFIGLSQ